MILSGFINGLKKSFSGKTYTRELHRCPICNGLSFINGKCLFCQTKEDFDKK